MILVTITSANYLSQTVCMLESLRVWHPDLPVTVYALELDWSATAAAALRPFGVTVEMLRETDRRSRGDPHRNNEAVHYVWKLDVFLAQARPFLYLDSDILITRPINGALAYLTEHDWLTVNEGTPLGRYHEGQITTLVQIPESARALPSFNTGVLGCDPVRYRDVFMLARDWAHQIQAIHLGDQGLLNLAWFHLRGQMPPSGGAEFNGGVGALATVDLSHTILHFTGDRFWQYLQNSGLQREQVQRAVWQAWPKGLSTMRLVDTPFWRASLPHPWTYLNQCMNPRHRATVAALREASLTLRGVSGIVVRDAYEAYLLHADILSELDAFWKHTAPRFAGLHHLPTYHLYPPGRLRSRWARHFRRCSYELRAFLPC